MNKLIYSTKELFTAVGSSTLILDTVSLQPAKDLSNNINTLKTFYPEVYFDYAATTELYRKKKILNNLLGRSYWFGYPDCKQRVALTFVSRKVGRWHCPVIKITARTVSGLELLLLGLPPSIEVHCSKLNVANFGIPWPETEKHLNKVLEKFPKHKVVVHSK